MSYKVIKVIGLTYIVNMIIILGYLYIYFIFTFVYIRGNNISKSFIL